MCLIAPSLPLLIVARLGQGLAAAVVASTARALGRDLFAGRDLAAFYSTMTAVVSSAPIIGPLLGGLLVGTTGAWQSVFVMVVAFGALALAFAIGWVPETLPRQARIRASQGVELTGVESAAVPTELLEREADAPSRSAMGAVLRTPTTVIAAAIMLFGSGAVVVYTGGGTFLLQVQYGLTPGSYSLVLAGSSLVLVVTSLLNVRLTRRFRSG